MKKMAGAGMIVVLAVIILLYIQIQNFIPAQKQGKDVRQDACGNVIGENAFREAAGKGDSFPLDGKYRKVLLAYAEYLQQYCGEDPGDANRVWMKFDLVFIDADDIPELLIILSDSHADGVDIYVYHDGDVAEAGGRFGSRGTFMFKPGENLICSTFFNMGEGFTSFYRIEGTESVELQAFHDCLVEYSGRQDLGDLYEVDGVRVSGEEYEEVWKKWEDEFEELVVWGYDDAVSMQGFDGSDDLYGELCRRFFLAKGQNHAREAFAAGSMHSIREQAGSDGTMTEAVPEAKSRKQNKEQEFPDYTQDNREVFNRAVKMLKLSEAEAEECFQMLCEDDVFQGGTGQLTAFLTGDFDGNGHRDMAAMIHQYPYGNYGSGCIYIYMNEDEPYCFLDDEFPFRSAVFNDMHISGGDLDDDGIIELVVEASGTGNGGAGDWHGRILKYKDHGLEMTEMIPKDGIEIPAQVMREGENMYSVYFPELDAEAAFEAREVFPYEKEDRPVGSNLRGLYEMRCTEYKGGYALCASEFLFGEGGNAHYIADARFIIVWDEEGNRQIAEWWIEPVNSDRETD